MIIYIPIYYLFRKPDLVAVMLAMEIQLVMIDFAFLFNHLTEAAPSWFFTGLELAFILILIYRHDRNSTAHIRMELEYNMFIKVIEERRRIHNEQRNL